MLSSARSAVRHFAICEVANDTRVVADPVDGVTALIVLAGTMYLRLPDETRHDADAGNLVVLPPGLQVQISPTAEAGEPSRARLTRRRGLPTIDAAAGRPGDLRLVLARMSPAFAAAARLAFGATSPVIEPLRGDSLGQAALAELTAEIDDPRPAASLMVTGLVMSCLAIFLRRRLARATEAIQVPRVDPRVAVAVANVLEAPGKPHSIDTLAAKAGMTRSTFVRQFSEAVGTSPMSFVLRARLRAALELLKSTNLPVKAIAARTGFLSRSHFSRAFRKEHGQDPSSFRDAVVGDAVDPQLAPLDLAGDQPPL
jgi:AraC family transcriptional activator of mtrCDE